MAPYLEPCTLRGRLHLPCIPTERVHCASATACALPQCFQHICVSTPFETYMYSIGNLFHAPADLQCVLT